MSSRHAYLILAHHRPELLAELLAALDDPRNDIYVHIDAKSGHEMDPEHFACKHARLIFTEKRVNVHWGAYSMVAATLVLLERALADGDHLYYHLLCGVSYPLKSQEELFAFFDEHAGTDFVELCEDVMEERVQMVYPFMEMGRPEDLPLPLRVVRNRIGPLFTSIQKVLGVRRMDKAGMEVARGSQMWSITQELAAETVAKKDLIAKLFKNTCCPDEHFMQMIVVNGDRREYASGGGDGGMVATTWAIEVHSAREGHRYKLEDLDYLMDSGLLYARKFDGPEGPALIEVIKARIGLPGEDGSPSSL